MNTLAYLFATSFMFATMAHSATSDLTLTSSSQYLVDAFNWNKSKALSWVETGKSNNIPCYRAAYAHRECFCIRDACHQCEGAALLGLIMKI